jgi:hypothetical protein
MMEEEHGKAQLLRASVVVDVDHEGVLVAAL